MKIGKKLKEAREKKGMSQADVGRVSGIHMGAITHFENDRRQPTIQTLAKLCKALGADANVLLGLKK